MKRKNYDGWCVFDPMGNPMVGTCDKARSTALLNAWYSMSMTGAGELRSAGYTVRKVRIVEVKK
jgi:hypothetical protein